MDDIVLAIYFFSYVLRPFFFSSSVNFESESIFLIVLANLNASSLDNFLIYVNGSMSQQSKVFEFILPAVFDSIPLNWLNPQIKWTFTDPDLFSAKISGAYRLPN